MKKMWMSLAAAMLAVSLFGATASASPWKSYGSENDAKTEKRHGQEKEQAGKHEDDDDHDSVTGNTYGQHGHQGWRGLSSAWTHIKDKPARQVIEQLLAEKYGIRDIAEMLKQQAEGQTDGTVTGVTYDELKSNVDALRVKIKIEIKVKKDQASVLSTLADVYQSTGAVTDALDVEKEAVAADPTNLESYKKLGKLLEKAGKTGVKAYVNGVAPEFDVPPVIKDGTTLVPFRAIAEALKAEVSWNQEEQSVTVTKDGTVVKLVLGSTTAYVNGKEVKLEVPGQLLNGRTVVPVRFISESFKANVDWEPESQSVVINEATSGN
jgi:hypothetical protein